MIPNKTEEQILYQQFKFYDLESSGFCNLQNFIKANDRLGVVLPNIENFEIIFNYFADKESTLLNYRKFIQEIFNFKSQKEQNEKINRKKNNKDFIFILTKKILEKGGVFPLVQLVKNLKMEDFENNKWLNFDNFLKVLHKCKIFLTSDEINNIYNEFDFFLNGIVKYEILIDIILNQFWDNDKLGLCEQIYYMLTGNGKKSMNLNGIKKLFERILEDNNDKKYFIEFINEYQYIDKNNINQNMNLKDLVKFFQYYNFGRLSNEYLEEILNILIAEDKKEKELNKQKKCNKITNKEIAGKKINNYLEEGYEDPILNEVYSKLREKFIIFGRKTLFNFLKHFKFYDNKTKNISKCNFSKILKNFNIKLSIDDIDIIFKNFSTDNIYNSMNYQIFLKNLVLGYVSNNRRNIINYIYDSLLKRAESFEREIDINFLKEEYNAINNYFIKEENENRNEFEECLETFHYSFNGLKNEKINKNEFCDFYYFISFLIEDEDDFVELISNEWKINISNNQILDNINKIDKNKNEYNQENIKDTRHIKNNLIKKIDIKEAKEISPLKNENYNELYSNEAQKYALCLLTNKLLKRGIRGVLYLYSQFLSLYPSLDKITFNDFVFVLKIQHLDLDIESMKKIFNMFTVKQNEKLYLDFYSFMRTYKKELNEKKLNAVEEAFSRIDSKGEDKVSINTIKMKYNAAKHPSVIIGKCTEDEKVMEFLDCFGLCYNILKLDSNFKNDDCNNNEYVDFEIFANFYEYVSFIYPRDSDFERVVKATWN